jgi:hypothetical protein
LQKLNIISFNPYIGFYLQKMRTIILAIIFSYTSISAFAEKQPISFSNYADTSKSKQLPDSVKLEVDGNYAYYQKVIKLDSSITEPLIYIRAVQFMASRNITQTYGYQEEGKLIFSTFQDLNINAVSITDDNETVQPYSVQFAITLDLKNKLYRYTINNVVFFLPSETGNRRETLYDIYQKYNNTDSRRIARDAKKLLASFERYLTSLTNDLRDDIEQRQAGRKSNF